MIRAIVWPSKPSLIYHNRFANDVYTVSFAFFSIKTKKVFNGSRSFKDRKCFHIMQRKKSKVHKAEPDC